jgi:site-specific DNA-methyltransferase (adenine-specific)
MIISRDILSDDGSLWILAPWTLASDLYQISKSLSLHLRQPLTWYDPYGVYCSEKFGLTSLTLLYFLKNERKRIFNKDEPLIRCPSDRQLVFNDKRANPEGKLWPDVWGVRAPIHRVAGTHDEREVDLPDDSPQLPVSLLEPIVLAASRPKQLVIDPMCGTGTAGIACLKHGRRFLGFDCRPDIVKIACRRLTSYARTQGQPS